MDNNNNSQDKHDTFKDYNNFINISKKIEQVNELSNEDITFFVLPKNKKEKPLMYSTNTIENVIEDFLKFSGDVHFISPEDKDRLKIGNCLPRDIGTIYLKKEVKFEKHQNMNNFENENKNESNYVKKIYRDWFID